MQTVRLTVAQGIVRWLCAQRSEMDGREVPLFPGVFAIFGHGNLTSLGHALQQAGDELPTWRGQNEQGMAMAALAYAKAVRRRQIMVATSSIGPGATNMVTAAGAAMANRIPLLLLSGDTFVSRTPDPVLQQVEQFGDPSVTVNDAFRPVVRYWDRIVRPSQLVSSLPQALAAMLDPATAGPAFFGLPQDVQAEAWDFPVRFFEPILHRVPRPRPSSDELARAAELLEASKAPLIVAGGGVHYSLAEETLSGFAARYGIPVVETLAGKSCLEAGDPSYAGPVGVMGTPQANELASRADLILALGTRLQDFTTGSWTVFSNEQAPIVTINAARFDASKHLAHAVVGDVKVALEELGRQLGDWRADTSWTAAGRLASSELRAIVGRVGPDQPAPGYPGRSPSGLPSYAEVVAGLNALANEDDYVVASSGGFPGELNVNWLSKAVASFDCEYGYSTMGYEIAGAWGAAMARRTSHPSGEVIAFVGDGSYLMMNSDLYSSVIAGHKMVVVLCDNGGYAVIERLQVNQGGLSFNNMLVDCRVTNLVEVDFVAHASAMGCHAERVATVGELADAFEKARTRDVTTVLVIKTDPSTWTGGGAFWEVGVPEVSELESVRSAREVLDANKKGQRIGW